MIITLNNQSKETKHFANNVFYFISNIFILTIKEFLRLFIEFLIVQYNTDNYFNIGKNDFDVFIRNKEGILMLIRWPSAVFKSGVVSNEDIFTFFIFFSEIKKYFYY